MKAYSLDLRQKIVDAYLEGKISQRLLAKQFRVALSFIEKLLKQYRETESIAPKVRRQQTPTKLNQGNRSGGDQKNARYEITRNQYEN